LSGSTVRTSLEDHERGRRCAGLLLAGRCRLARLGGHESGAGRFRRPRLSASGGTGCRRWIRLWVPPTVESRPAWGVGLPTAAPPSPAPRRPQLSGGPTASASGGTGVGVDTAFGFPPTVEFQTGLGVGLPTLAPAAPRRPHFPAPHGLQRPEGAGVGVDTPLGSARRWSPDRLGRWSPDTAPAGPCRRLRGRPQTKPGLRLLTRRITRHEPRPFGGGAHVL